MAISEPPLLSADHEETPTEPPVVKHVAPVGLVGVAGGGGGARRRKKIC